MALLPAALKVHTGFRRRPDVSRCAVAWFALSRVQVLIRVAIVLRTQNAFAFMGCGRMGSAGLVTGLTSRDLASFSNGSVIVPSTSCSTLRAPP